MVWQLGEMVDSSCRVVAREEVTGQLWTTKAVWLLGNLSDRTIDLYIMHLSVVAMLLQPPTPLQACLSRLYHMECDPRSTQVRALPRWESTYAQWDTCSYVIQIVGKFFCEIRLYKLYGYQIRQLSHWITPTDTVIKLFYFETNLTT